MVTMLHSTRDMCSSFLIRHDLANLGTSLRWKWIECPKLLSRSMMVSRGGSYFTLFGAWSIGNWKSQIPSRQPCSKSSWLIGGPKIIRPYNPQHTTNYNPCKNWCWSFGSGRSFRGLNIYLLDILANVTDPQNWMIQYWKCPLLKLCGNLYMFGDVWPRQAAKHLAILSWHQLTYRASCSLGHSSSGKLLQPWRLSMLSQKCSTESAPDERVRRKHGKMQLMQPTKAVGFRQKESS
jgi:hypothetical protein